MIPDCFIIIITETEEVLMVKDQDNVVFGQVTSDMGTLPLEAIHHWGPGSARCETIKRSLTPGKHHTSQIIPSQNIEKQKHFHAKKIIRK